MKLSKRLDAIASLVPNNSILIDVACDHGLLGLNLLMNARIESLILTDISENALSMAKKNAKKMGLNPTFYHTDGLANIPLHGEETIVIAGVGNDVMINILNSANISNQTIILATQSHPYRLRKYMADKYKLIDELLIYENKHYYFILKYVVGNDKLSKKQLYFGPILLSKQDIVFKQYCNYLYTKYLSIYQHLSWKYMIKKLKLLSKLKFIKKASV